MPEPILRAEALSSRYNRDDGPVLRDLDLTLAAGQSLAIVGPSGSGKSTLLHLLNGLLRPDSGRLELFGQATAGLGDSGWASWRRQRIATVFQDDNLIPTLTLGRNVAFRAALAGKADHERERHLMEVLGIGTLASRYPDQVSGGQRQRAAIAAAFAMEPQLLLADEPTGSLDQATAEKVSELLFQGIRERGLGAIVATHNLTLAARCDRLLELTGGRLTHPAPSTYSASL